MMPCLKGRTTAAGKEAGEAGRMVEYGKRVALMAETMPSGAHRRRGRRQEKSPPK